MLMREMMTQEWEPGGEDTVPTAERKGTEAQAGNMDSFCEAAGLKLENFKSQEATCTVDEMDSKQRV